MFDKFDRNAISNENLYYANLKKEKRIKDQTDEMEREKIAMANLKTQMEKEKQYLKDKKEKIKQAQYEDYNNYIMQKYSTPPQYREKLNIKLGGEQRNIRKTNYNDEMDNLCLNPTNQKYEEYPNAINYSDMGRKYQKGYSHGYNIITGEVYSNNNNNYTNNNYIKNNEDYNNYNNNPKEIKEVERDERKGISISPEEYEEFLRYKEMKRQKEMEMGNKQQIKKDQYNNNINNNIRNNEYVKQPKENINQYQNYYQNVNTNNKKEINNNFHYDDKNEPSERFNEIKEKENFIQQQNKYYEDYQNRLLNQNQRQEEIPQYYNEQQNINNNLQINQENNINSNNKNNENTEYVYENIHRKFTQSDIDFIYDFCNGLAEIIICELKDNVTDFFLKKDNNRKGYLTVKEFEDILYHDLKIDYKNDMNNFQVFLEFILSDKVAQGEYIIEINKLIFIIKTYSEKYNQINNNSDNRQYEENEEQIQFKDKISFPSNQQNNLNEQNNNYNNNIRNREQLSNQYQNNENINNIKDIEREKYLQFLKEQSGQNNPTRNYPPEENYNNNNNSNNIYQRQNQNEFNNRNNAQNNNYNNAPLNNYYNQRELTPQPQPQNQFLSYQEQIKRIQEQNKYQQENKQISEYNKNKMKNMNTEDNIFKSEKPTKIEHKYNDMPLSEKEKKEIIQKDYAKYLDWQIQEKNRNVKTPFYPRNYNPILDDNNYMNK